MTSGNNNFNDFPETTSTGIEYRKISINPFGRDTWSGVGLRRLTVIDEDEP